MQKLVFKFIPKHVSTTSLTFQGLLQFAVKGKNLHQQGRKNRTKMKPEDPLKAELKREPSLSSDSFDSDDDDDSDVDVDGIDEDAATLAAALDNQAVAVSVVLDIQVHSQLTVFFAPK